MAKTKIKVKKLSKQALLEQKAYQRGIMAERRAWKKKFEAQVAEAVERSDKSGEEEAKIEESMPPPFKVEPANEVDEVIALVKKLGAPHRMPKQRFIEFVTHVMDELDLYRDATQRDVNAAARNAAADALPGGTAIVAPKS